MKGRFIKLCEEIGTSIDAHTLWGYLQLAYRGRTYHNLEHIRYCLEVLDNEFPQDMNRKHLEFAIFYHDVRGSVYESTQEACKDLAFIYDREVVAGLIMATDHQGIHSGQRAMICDIDLAILGETEENFDKYEEQIRAEYQEYDDRDFYPERERILTSLIKPNGTVYIGKHFQNNYGRQQQLNYARAFKRYKEILNEQQTSS
jgi:predicted metal-dependent HD superfamily phosphohydrolase